VEVFRKEMCWRGWMVWEEWRKIRDWMKEVEEDKIWFRMDCKELNLIRDL